MEKYLFYALKKRDITKVIQLLQAPGYDINAVDRKKQTPLIQASKLGLVPVVEELLRQNVELNRGDNSGRTALHQAAAGGYANIVRLLMKAGCDIHSLNEEGDEALHEGITSGSLSGVEALLEGGCDVNRANHVTRTTPLDLAVMAVSPDIVALLNRHKADLHWNDQFLQLWKLTALYNIISTSNAKETALHYAVQVGSQRIIDQLLEAGININAVNRLGESALSIAIQLQQLDTVKYLIQTGCDLYSQDYVSPLTIACRLNSPDIIRYLLSEGYNASKDKFVRGYIYLKLEETDPDLLCFVYHRCENPLSLKELCRLVIRRRLFPNVADAISRLQIPQILQSWVSADVIY